MKTYRSRELGITLLETVLALAIAGAIVVLSLRQYQIYKQDADMQQMVATVDQLFQAAAKYYYANCKGGRLDPANSPNQVVILSIPNDLVAAGYLPANPIPNAIASSYVVQLFLSGGPRYLCISNPSGPCTYQQFGTNYNWTIEVGVALKNPTSAPAYLSAAQATCQSSSYYSVGVAPCFFTSTFNGSCIYYNTPSGIPALDAANQVQAQMMGCSTSSNNPSSFNNMLVWDRLPSMASPNSLSDMWTVMPTLQQFKRSYEINPTSGITTNEYFLCGS